MTSLAKTFLPFGNGRFRNLRKFHPAYRNILIRAIIERGCRSYLREQTQVISSLGRIMIVCPDCGNKRCPHATDHNLSCTGSNEPDQLSDGYHTFEELYSHRNSLMLALMRVVPNRCWFSERHENGELPFGSADWFIVGAELPTGSISYHLPKTLLPIAKETGALELKVGMHWDGHTSEDVVDRLLKWVGL